MLKYEDNLWGKVDFLHSRYHNIYSNLCQYLEMMSKFQLAFLNFSKSISSISNKKYKIYSDKKLSLYPVIGSIPKNISLHSKEFFEISEFIKDKVIEQAKISLNETYTKENNLYLNYIKSKRNYNNSKIDLEKSKNDFNDKSQICENLIVNAKSMKYKNIVNKKEIEKNETKANEGLTDAISYENKYIEYLKETNKNIDEKNKKELDLLKMYEEIDKEIVIKIKGIICMYIAGFKKMYSTILADFTWINNQFKKINSDNDINIFINKYKTNLHKEEKIPFIPYEPKSCLNPTLIKPTGDPIKDENILDINYEVISSLKKNLKDVCPSIDMEEEAKKKRLRYLVSKIFTKDVDFKDEEKKELLEYVKEKPFRYYFLLMLSKQRTKGRYKRSEKLINDLSDLLNVILDGCEKDKDYLNAKNCIILSQTYYCEITKSNKKRYKYYLFKNIQNNKWLNTVEYWEVLIEMMIQEEIKNNEQTAKKYKYNEKLKKNALSNIGFSQLLPLTQNMYEFGIPKEKILSICQKYIDKYGVKKEYSETLINNIKNCSNIDFEEEIIDEDPKIKKNPKRKKTLPENENENTIEEFIPNSMYNKSNINLLDSEDDKIDNEININNDSNINIINENKDENNKKENLNINKINDLKENEDTKDE